MDHLEAGCDVCVVAATAKLEIRRGPFAVSPQVHGYIIRNCFYRSILKGNSWAPAADVTDAGSAACVAAASVAVVA